MDVCVQNNPRDDETSPVSIASDERSITEVLDEPAKDKHYQSQQGL